MRRRPAVERRSHERADPPWKWWKRFWFAGWHGLHRFLIHPFLEMAADGSYVGSMPAWMAFGIVCMMIDRLRPHVMPNGNILIIPASGSDAIIVLGAFIGVPLYAAAVKLVNADPEKLVDAVFSRIGVGEVAGGAGIYQYAIDEMRPRTASPDPE